MKILSNQPIKPTSHASMNAKKMNECYTIYVIERYGSIDLCVTKYSNNKP